MQNEQRKGKKCLLFFWAFYQPRGAAWTLFWGVNEM